MKDQLRQLVQQALAALRQAGSLPPGADPDFAIDRCRDKSHGDFACNAAMLLAKSVGAKPRDLAASIVAALPASADVAGVEIAGPGFINFRLRGDARQAVIAQVLDGGVTYGRAPTASRASLTVEFVSANPNGPLHVGHGRGAAYGATLSNLLEAHGHPVQREYYVNDAGRQMDILAVSVWLRYLEACGESVRFPDNGYKGDYVHGIAAGLRASVGERLRHPPGVVFADLPADESQGGDKELHVDALIARARALLGADDYRVLHAAGLDTCLADIRADLEAFGVHHDNFFSERSLNTSGAIARAVERLKTAGHMYERDGALWFRATTFGDDKDRVVVRENGATTYFASDIAYLLAKFERGFDRAIYVLGADHHGYVARLKAAAQGMGLDPERIEVPLVQFAVLYEHGEKVQMSTRAGQFVTLRQLREDVGRDAARFFYVMRGHEQHLDFDLDLARSQSNDNPVYYLQYAHARICSLFRQLAEKGLSHDRGAAVAARAELTEAHEEALLDALARYPEALQAAAANRSPQVLTTYLRELATAFHAFYNAHPVLGADAGLRDARLDLCLAVRQVLANGLELVGVSAPERM